MIIEGLDKFVEHDSEEESIIKFWLPKFFPKRVKVIVTADKGSKSFAYLQKLGCQTIMLDTSQQTMTQVIKNYENRKFVMPATYSQAFMNILKSKIDKGLILKTLFIKTAISCLCPYESSGIMNFDNV